jgi:hypothetical protein
MLLATKTCNTVSQAIADLLLTACLLASQLENRWNQVPNLPKERFGMLNEADEESLESSAVAEAIRGPRLICHPPCQRPLHDDLIR